MVTALPEKVRAVLSHSQFIGEIAVPRLPVRTIEESSSWELVGMSEITAAKVKSFRERTGLPLMECKSALTEAGGDEEKAVAILRERGEKLGDKRSDRETAFGRFGLYFGLEKPQGAIVELKCESAPVTQNEEFIQLANDMAQALALTEADISTADELLALESPSQSGVKLGDQMAELFNRIREKFEVGRMQKLDGTCGGYFHNSGTVAGVLIQVDGGSDAAAKDVAMHIAAMRPAALSKDELDPAKIEKEREFLRSAAIKEGKPENIVDKMVEGRLRNYFAEHTLLEQPFVKDDKQTVSQYAKGNDMQIKNFVHYELGSAVTSHWQAGSCFTLPNTNYPKSPCLRRGSFFVPWPARQHKCEASLFQVRAMDLRAPPAAPSLHARNPWLQDQARKSTGT